MRSGLWVSTVVASVLFPCAATAENRTVVGFPRAEARSSTWIAVEAPFLGDENDNGYTVIRIGSSLNGPFTPTSPLPTGGQPALWRTEVITQLIPDTPYYFEVEYFDPDGVTDPVSSSTAGGKASIRQVFGPIRTLSSAPLAVRVENAVAENRPNEILVRVPISDDSNASSQAIFEIAEASTSETPISSLNWSTRCGPPGPLHPKICRIRSLTPGRTYRIRVTVTDLDGVSGPATQVLPGIRYTGGDNVAFGKPIAVAPPGAGCCTNPAELTDGRIQYGDSAHGFAWPGGTSCSNGGCPAGDNKTATVDLGALTQINQAAIWFHDAQRVPLSWKLETSSDGVNFQQVQSATEPQCRAVQLAFRTDWSFPACAHTASFAPVNARFVRYRFDDSTLFGGLNGWLVELEVFRSGELTVSPPALAFLNQPVGTTSSDQIVTFTNTGLAPVTFRGPQILLGAFGITNRCPTVLNMNASCSVAVRFTGSAASINTPGTATLAFEHDGVGSPEIVQLSGTSVAVAGPLITIDKSSLTFPAVAVDAQTAEQRLNVTNVGTQSALQAVSSGSAFMVRNTCPPRIGPGSCAIFVTFKPTAAQSFSETLNLSWDGGSQVVSLFGSARADTDQDGIPDEWEVGEAIVLGETINLAAMGAKVGVKDVFVELDYWHDVAHTHQPKPEAIKKAVDAYWAHGIALHVDCGPSCVMDPATGALWEAQSRSNAVPHEDPITTSTSVLGSLGDSGSISPGGYSWASFDATKTANLSRARSVIFRYGVFAHQLAGSSLGTTGLARLQRQGGRQTASDFIVSLGATVNNVGNISEQAGTFTHELGHNLGLPHGGCATNGGTTFNCELTPYKPNYLSVMNYLFQMRGIFINGFDGVIDYSNSELPKLKEKSLDESKGLDLGMNPPNVGTRYWCGEAEQPVPQATGSINWDCQTQTTGVVSADINDFAGLTDLLGAKDWDKLVFAGGAVGQAGAPPPQPEFTPTEELEELTVEQDQKITTIYGVSIKTNNSLRLAPGARGSVTFTVVNRGVNPDMFKLATTVTPSVASWVDTSTVPSDIPLAAGGMRTITVGVVAPPAGGFGEVVLRAQSVGNANAFDVGRVAITSALADIAVRVMDAPDPLLVGNRLTYSAVVENLGPSGARDVRLSAELPSGLGSLASTGAVCLGKTKVVCSVGDLASGQRVTVTLMGTPESAGILRAVFRTTGATTDPNSANDEAVTSTAVTGRPLLAATMTEQSRSGSNLTLQILFRNTGSEPAVNVTIRGLDARVLGGSGAVVVTSPATPVLLGNIAPGATASLRVSLTVPSTVTRLTLTESGSLQDARGTSYAFSLAQGITP